MRVEKYHVPPQSIIKNLAVILSLIIKFCRLWFSGNLLTQENISGVLTEVPPLISESDLHISQVRKNKMHYTFIIMAKIIVSV